MFSPSFGLKTDFSYDKLENNPDTQSLPFDTEQLRWDVQAVVNGSRLFDIQDDLGRFNFLFHGGFELARVTPKYNNPSDPIENNYNVSENNVGIIFGIMPEFRIFNNFSIFADFYAISNFRQHFAWDGHYANSDNNLTGAMINASVGLTYSFGSKDDIHGDWAIVENKNTEELAALDQRIGELETMMNDSDKDGVPDYLDVENNSIAGVAVDTKGRMIDRNKNGVPDELENYLNNTYVEKANIAKTIDTANADMTKRLVNDGYVTAYFETGKTSPTDASSEGIDFMLTYLRANPSASVDIIGHADAIGSSKVNDKLALERANNVRTTLIKAGISPSRLTAISGGIDDSVDKDSSDARRLVRRVTFKLK
jgi:OOP family OmpA-OmpF porin